MARPFQSVAFQSDLPPVLAAQAMNEGRRRAHNADPLGPVAQQPARQLLGCLARNRCSAGVVSIRPREHGQLRKRREHKRFP